MVGGNDSLLLDAEKVAGTLPQARRDEAARE
jgi:hypothetical protein